METIEQQIAELTDSYAEELASISPDAEVTHLGGNIFGIVDLVTFGVITFANTYTVTDGSLPICSVDEHWIVTVRDAAQEPDSEAIMFEHTGPLREVTVAAAGFMRVACE